MNVIAGIIGGVVGAVLTLAVRVIVNHPLACLTGLAAPIALARGVPALVVVVALVAVALTRGAIKGK